VIDVGKQMGPFTHCPELDDLAYRMFREFSRFEYALKARRYLLNPNGDAKAAWDRFAKDIHPAFEERLSNDADLGQAVDYLMNHPPKKQVARQNELGWSDVRPEADTPTGVLLLCVRRVRNNLFHGGKFSRGWIDPHRSSRLITASLTVLNGCLELSDPIREAYEH